MRIERGEVYWVDVDPSIGGETKRTRPAIIISNNAANVVLNRVQVVPITSKTGRVYRAEAIIRIRGEERKAMGDQLTTVSMERLGGKLGNITSEEMARVEAAVAIQLALTLK
jgi:mRNA interferase MazF